MKYVVMSTTVQDNIHFPNNDAEICAAGGAGMYALAGMRVWEEDVGIVSGVGEDYAGLFGKWYHENAVTTRGLRVKDEYTPCTVIEYFQNGERKETPLYGKQHYKKLEPTPEDLAGSVNDAAGVYIFRDSNPEFWAAIFKLKEQYGFHIMWELSAASAKSDCLASVLQTAQNVEMFSLNRTEALSLFEADSMEEAIQRLQRSSLGLVYLRNGADGVYLIQKDVVCHVPSVAHADVVDPTGGGNSSTGAALVGFCQGKELREIGAMGNVASAFCIAQYGVPPHYDGEMRRLAEERFQEVLKRATYMKNNEY